MSLPHRKPKSRGLLCARGRPRKTAGADQLVFVAGAPPGAPPAYMALCSLVCDSADSFQAAMQQHGAEIMGDIPNYTDTMPVIQVSEVVVELA